MITNLLPEIDNPQATNHQQNAVNLINTLLGNSIQLRQLIGENNNSNVALENAVVREIRSIYTTS